VTGVKLNLAVVERPGSSGAVKGSPILLALHGWATYRDHLFEMTRLVDPRLLVVAAQAPLRMGPGAYRWFDFERVPDQGPRINDDEEASSLAALCEFIDRLVAHHEPQRLYLMGHSQGGTMLFSVALKRPQGITGFANVNGRLLDKRAAEVAGRSDILRDVAFFCGHGTHNDIVPLWLGERSRDAMVEQGAQMTYHQYRIGHEITAEAVGDIAAWLTRELDLWRARK
jgi:phospholipase/carboxylesterase